MFNHNHNQNLEQNMTIHLIFSPNMFGEIADWTSLSARRQIPSLCLRFSQYYSRFRFNYNLIVEVIIFLWWCKILSTQVSDYHHSCRVPAITQLFPDMHIFACPPAGLCFKLKNYFLSQTQSMCLLNTKNLDNHSTIMFITWSKAKVKAMSKIYQLMLQNLHNTLQCSFSGLWEIWSKGTRVDRCRTTTSCSFFTYHASFSRWWSRLWTWYVVKLRTEVEYILCYDRGMLTLELSSYVLHIPNDAETPLDQNLIGCSTLSQGNSFETWTYPTIVIIALHPECAVSGYTKISNTIIPSG